MGMTYLRNCTEGEGPAITEMVDAARDISRKTFLKHVNKDSLRTIERDLGYVLNKKHGLTMANDYHVQYGKSKFKGQPCIFFCWSAIEWVFV